MSHFAKELCAAKCINFLPMRVFLYRIFKGTNEGEINKISFINLSLLIYAAFRIFALILNVHLRRLIFALHAQTICVKFLIFNNLNQNISFTDKIIF